MSVEVYSVRSIEGFPEYVARSDGNIVSLRSGLCLTPLRVPSGYRHVVLCGAIKKRLAVHVVVAMAWHGNPPPDHVVNHKDGNKSNNHPDNLEWVTRSENCLHAYRTGLRVIGAHHRAKCAELGRSKRSFTPEQHKTIRAAYTGKRGQLVALASALGLSRYAIRSALEVSP